MRGAALLVAGALVAAVAGFGAAVAGQSSGGRLDDVVDRHLISGLSGRRCVVRAAADLGDAVPVIVVLAVVVGWLVIRRRLRAAALIVLAPLVTVGVCELVAKPLVDRTLDGVSVYPSGHEAVVAAVATAVAVVFAGRRARWVQAVGFVALVLVCLASAIGLVAARYHYATDTVGGAGLGVAVALFVAVGMDAVTHRRGTMER